MNFTNEERQDLLDALSMQSGERWAALAQRLADEKTEALTKNKSSDNDYTLGRCYTLWIDVEGIEDLHVWMRVTDPEGILVEIYGKDVMKPRLASCSFRYQ